MEQFLKDPCGRNLVRLGSSGTQKLLDECQGESEEEMVVLMVEMFLKVTCDYHDCLVDHDDHIKETVESTIGQYR
jgi:hypothetical protein